jgi:hypothetical protein
MQIFFLEITRSIPAKQSNLMCEEKNKKLAIYNQFFLHCMLMQKVLCQVSSLPEKWIYDILNPIKTQGEQGKRLFREVR